MKFEKYLPIGTVVLLKGAQKKVMITGFCVKGDSADKMYDYCGCVYPEGVLNSNKNLLFNHDQLESIFYMGYITDEEKEFKNKLNGLIQKVEVGEIQFQNNN